MAKKKTAQKKKASRKPAPKRQSRKEIKRVLSGVVRSRRPQTPPLPGLEDLGLIPALDRVCGTLADIRHELNELRGQEKEEVVTALRELRKASRTAYKSHGIELVRVAGDEKVRVRLVKGEGAADAEPDDDNPHLEAMDTENAIEA